MKTTTSIFIAAGAVMAVIGISTAVNAGSERGAERDCSGRYHHTRGPAGPGAGPMSRHPMFANGMMGPMIMKRAFELADADKDGRLTDPEIDDARTEQFEKHDVDGDGTLTLEEFDLLLRELTRPVTVRAFQFLDPDGDAAITKEEFDGPTSRIVRLLDRNDDGALSIDDRPDFHRGGFGHGRYDEENDGN